MKDELINSFLLFYSILNIFNEAGLDQTISYPSSHKAPSKVPMLVSSIP